MRVEGGARKADDGGVSDPRVNPKADDSGQELIEALPEPRAGGGADSEVASDPEQSATWVEYKRSRPGKGAGDASRLGAEAGESSLVAAVVPTDLDPSRTGSMETPELARHRHHSLLYAVTHLGDPHERKVLLRYLRLKRGLIASALVVLVGAISVAIAIGFALARSAPSWWVDIDAEDPRNIQLAELVQNGALSHLFEDRQSLVGGSVEWPVKMTDEAANAWMNIKLPEWFAKISDGLDWPESVQQLQMVFDNGTIRIGARVRTDIGTRIYSCAIVPELHEDGSLWMKAQTVSMGRLTMPAGWVLSGADTSAAKYIPEQLRGTAEAEALFEKLTGQLPLFDIAEVSLGDGRRVRLLGLRVRDGTVIAHCVTMNPE